MLQHGAGEKAEPEKGAGEKAGAAPTGEPTNGELTNGEVGEAPNGELAQVAPAGLAREAPWWYPGKPGEGPGTGDAPGARSGAEPQAVPAAAHWLVAGDGSWWAAGAACRAAWPAFSSRKRCSPCSLTIGDCEVEVVRCVQPGGVG